MFCTNCGKNIEKDSKFCQFCGAKISGEGRENRNDNTIRSEENLWDKFVEIYSSKDEERKKFEDNSSNEVWELINRISVNTFESFIEEHKKVLNKQPYKAIEDLKLSYQLAASAGYWFWMSEALLNKERLGKVGKIDFEKFITEWQKDAIDNYAQISKKLSEELMVGMSDFHNIRIESLFETAPSLKELSNELIKKLKGELLMEILWGYIAGLTEFNYRK